CWEVIELIYGRSMGLISAGKDADEIIAAKEAAIKMGFGFGIVPWMARLLTTKFVSLRLQKPQYAADGRLIGIGAITEKIREPLKLAREGNLETVAPTILQHLIDDELDGGSAVQQDVTESEAMNAIFAGTGSTAAGLNAVLYELGIHGKWQVQVLIELQSLTPTSMETPWDLPYSGLSRLPYLRAIVKESLRLSPPFPSAFQREVSMNSGAVTIAGFAAALPPGTKISTNHYVMCRSRAVFGTDADEFHPERWLDTNDSEQLKRMEDAWSVFGRGARMCVGKDLVIMMLYKAVAAVLLQWEITGSANGMKRSNDFEFHVHELVVSLTPR
ncbi:MAG: hypothetical protein LQ347_002468, partial [Umbilicaria vellea]